MVKAEGNHFVYQDGSKYLPFGTTIYALAHQPETLIDQTMETLKQAPSLRNTMYLVEHGE